MAFFHSYETVLGLFTFALILLIVSSSAQLNPDFYETSCPQLLHIVKAVLNNTITKDKRMGASILRLHFHDCFVNGCDGSILLDDLNGERFASPNVNSVRGYEVIERIKSDVENLKACHGKVSCADILALAARESVVMLKGPSWKLGMGRRDGHTSNQKDAQNDLPSPSSNLDVLIAKFKRVGLNETDLVALSGAHTIGQAQCTNFRNRIYNDKDIDGKFAMNAKLNCPPGNRDGSKLEPLDHLSPDDFDKDFYTNLENNQGLLHSDQQLQSNAFARALVKKYSRSTDKIFGDFASAMVKMSNIKPLTVGGEIRKVCSKRN